MEAKTCSTCGKAYPATTKYFVKNKECRGGIASTCRECIRSYHRKWKSENSEYKERRRQQYQDKVKPRNAEIYRQKRLRRPYHQRAALMRSGMIARSRERGIPFDADLFTVKYLTEWLMDEGNCPCCGIAFDVQPKFDGLKNDASPSVDRIQPARGYVQGNVALLCWRCNNLKRDATPDELQRVVDWMRSVWKE